MPPAPTWHLVHVNTHQSDRHAAERLGRYHETYTPQERRWRPVQTNRLSRRQRLLGITRMEPLVRSLFPRYLFCRLRPGDAWHESFRAAGVSGIAVNRGLPVPVSDELVAALRGQEVDGAIPGSTPASRLFKVGQAIEVKEGSFKGLRGKIDKIKTAALDEIDVPLRLTVLLQMFGGLTPVEINAAAVG